jgi:methionine synthase I (cobalamin-dependent)
MSKVPAFDCHDELRAAAAERILVLDGAMGTMIQTGRATCAATTTCSC